MNSFSFIFAHGKYDGGSIIIEEKSDFTKQLIQIGNDRTFSINQCDHNDA